MAAHRSRRVHRPGHRWGVSGALCALAGLVGLGCIEIDAPGAPDPDPCDEPGTICTWMGVPGIAHFSPVGVDRREVGLYLPQDLAFGPDGVGYVADFNNHRVLAVRPDGIVEGVTGTGFPGDGLHDGGTCEAGCPALATEIWHPSQITVDPTRPEVVYTSAWHDHRLIETDRAEHVSTWVLGIGEPDYSVDPPALAYPSSMVIGEDGTWYIADQANQVVRSIAPGGALTLLAGTPGQAGYAGDGGPATEALLHGHDDWVGGPTSKLALDGRRLVLADTLNGVIRAVDLDRGTIEHVAGAVFSSPRAVAFGPDGALYVADSGNNCVRQVDADGGVTSFAGQCGEPEGFAGDEAPAQDATLAFPCGVVVDPDGNVYISDSNNHVIRRVARPGIGSTG